jgi:hypothetical protein
MSPAARIPMPTGIHGNPSPPAVIPPAAPCGVATTRVVAVGSVAPTGDDGVASEAVVGGVVVWLPARGTGTTSTLSASSPKATPRRTGDTVVGYGWKSDE